MEEINLYRYRYINLDVTFTDKAPPEVQTFLKNWGEAGFTFSGALLFCYKAELQKRDKKEGTIYPSVEVLDWIKHNIID